MNLVSYTLPCHKRERDLFKVLPSVIAAANHAPPVEIVVVDYGCTEPLAPKLWPLAASFREGVILRTIRCEREFFHMAHARNVGIKAARGEYVVAFLADLAVGKTFFAEVRRQMAERWLGLKYFEAFAFHREAILNAGGFDERFEFYGPEGKELQERLARNGYEMQGFTAEIAQRPTSVNDKKRNYRLKLSRREMHHLGMDIWRENTAANLTVANDGKDWGVAA